MFPELEKGVIGERSPVFRFPWYRMQCLLPVVLSCKKVRPFLHCDPPRESNNDLASRVSRSVVPEVAGMVLESRYSYQIGCNPSHTYKQIVTGDVSDWKGGCCDWAWEDRRRQCNRRRLLCRIEGRKGFRKRGSLILRRDHSVRRNKRDVSRISALHLITNFEMKKTGEPGRDQGKDLFPGKKMRYSNRSLGDVSIFSPYHHPQPRPRFPLCGTEHAAK